MTVKEIEAGIGSPSRTFCFVAYIVLRKIAVGIQMDVVHLKLETEIPGLRCVFNEGEELKFSYTSPSSVVVSFKQREPYDRNRPYGTGNGVCSAVTQLHIEPSIRSNIRDAIDNERISIKKNQT
jgi:hypothetical protein